MKQANPTKKMKNNPKKPKRNIHLLFQVGLIFAIIFTLVIVSSAIIQVTGSTQTFLEAKQEFMKPLSDKVASYYSQIDGTKWFFDYWLAHPEIGDSTLDEDQQVAELAELKEDFEIQEDGFEITFPKFDPEKLDSYTDRQKELLATYIYESIFSMNFISIYQLRNERFILLDVSDKYWGTTYTDTQDYIDALQGIIHPQLSYHLGDDYSEILNSLKSINKVKRWKSQVFERYDSPKDGKYYYVCITPIMADGEVRAVLLLTHDWSKFHSALMTKLFTIVAISALVIIVSSILLLFFIYRAAIRPLTKVQQGVREYVVEKKSYPIVQKMEQIRQRNEFGVLADDVSHLVVEMDRHTVAISKLTREKERVATELSLASNIQKGILPANFPEATDFELFAAMTPAKEVGGDLYDFFEIDETHLGLVIGDVSGKGVPAALFMMISKLVIREYGKTGLSPAEVLAKANATLCENNTNDMFVTIWFGIFDRSTGKITAASAGHEFPILRDPDGEFSLVKDRHGFVLGGMEMTRYTDYELELKPGGTLLIYTDGAAEATNAENELFGTDRMLEALNQHPEDHPKDVVVHLTEAINAFVGTAPQFDDLTMLCLRYNG